MTAIQDNPLDYKLTDKYNFQLLKNAVKYKVGFPVLCFYGNYSNFLVFILKF